MTDPRAEFREFRAFVEQAEAEAEVLVVGNLVELSKRDYRASIAWLERMAPDRWRLDQPALGASEDYRPVAIAHETALERNEQAFSLPATMIEPFVLAARQFHETGVVPSWVFQGAADQEAFLAGFHETADL